MATTIDNLKATVAKKGGFAPANRFNIMFKPPGGLGSFFQTDPEGLVGALAAGGNPLNVFNDTNIYGEWKNNTYLDNGFLDSSYLDGREIKVADDEKYYGEWILIMLDRKIQLNKINIDIGADGTNFTNFKIFGKNINKNDINLVENSEIINSYYFNNITYDYQLEGTLYKVNTSTNNYYNSFVILFENIEENKNT